MDKVPQDQNNQNAPPQGNPLLAALLGQMSGPSPAAAPPSPPPAAAVPSAGGAPGQTPPAPMQSPMGQGGGMSPIIQSLMGQAQQTMSNPMGQAVPQGGGPLDALKHPIVAALIKGLAQAAQGFGWTAMQPNERVERTQLQQQKAESLARLAETGAYQGGMLGVRQQQADTSQQRADTYQQQAETQKQRADAYERATAAKIDYEKSSLDIRKQLGEGKIQEAYAALSEKADDFTRKLEQDKDIAQQNIGIKQAHQSTYQGYVDMLGQLRSTALQQGNTKIAEQAQQKLAEIQSKSWVQDLFGMAGPSTAAGAAQAVGSPQALPVVYQPSTTQNVGTPTNKAQAKGGKSGGSHMYFDSQGNMVTK